ncbi:hypothetical protein DL89DRAFT_274726 [Linderina pennispora]|uniref:Pyrroline-5-carboxylate reductase catalytic N-terminal domain-containing protein n=1 Tax=Linderina pennispora TaxID=61395 RepID=A0A1Y1WC00_9FUNG|nr:uncharacterized protein DL89DRAFT_274726 [Linderina pennispora]ORX70895.1 hypothetical protein DL89DRAFT_274726 [Linderina pennispora]
MVIPNFEIGIIGAGDMGMLYAKRFRAAGYPVNICDTPERFETWASTFCCDGYAVSRRSDFIIYSVPAEYGRATKLHAIVAGQTSVKTPEIAAALGALEARMIYLTYQEHDRITADTQAATHLAFLSLGTAWCLQGYHPWINPQFIAGINNVKVAMALRIYASKWHVYAGLAIMNPHAKTQLQCYVESLQILYKCMVGGRRDEFTKLIYDRGRLSARPFFSTTETLDQLSLAQVPPNESRPNSHLSLLSAAVCWHKMQMSPYDNLIMPDARRSACGLGIVEYLFCNAEMLKEAIETALDDRYTQAGGPGVLHGGIGLGPVHPARVV